MTRARLEFGKWGEDTAVQYLANNGIQILRRNYRSPYGEVDIIGSSGESLIFFEVKTRSNSRFGLPEDSITSKKMKHIIESAEFFLQDHPEPVESWRIDLIAIQFQNINAPPLITWFENIAR